MRTTQIKPLMKQKMFYKTEKLIINLTSTLSQLQEHWELPLTQQKQHAIICKVEKIIRKLEKSPCCFQDSLLEIIEIGKWHKEKNEKYAIVITLEIKTELSQRGEKQYGANFVVENPNRNSELKADLKKFLLKQKNFKGIGIANSIWN